MASQEFSIVEHLDELKTILSGIVIKNNILANQNETLESLRNFEIYMMAYEENDVFSFHEYSRDMLISVGITGDLLEACVEDKNNVPANYTNALLTLKRQEIISNYNELNEYYRTFLGLPKIGTLESNFVYVNENEFPNLFIDYQTPIHLLDNSDVNKLYSAGVISKIYNKLGKKYEYINFLGKNRLNIIDIRKANDFDLLKIGEPKNNIIAVTFKKHYLTYRNMLVYTMFNQFYYDNYELYPSIFAWLIVFSTIQAMFNNVIDVSIGRDFIDINNINLFLESYDLSSLQGLPLSYKKTLIKNLNYLLTHKGNDKVIIDICAMFGFTDVNLFKTYLFRRHRLDENNRPLFYYIDDEFGHKVEDVNAMYELKFVDIPYDSDDIDLALSKENNYLDYDDVTVFDNLWGGGEISKEELKQEILKKNFTYALTKYISFRNMFDISKLGFEASYFFNMVLKLKSYFDDVMIPIKILDNTNNIKLFDLIIYLFSLTCKKYNYTGEILSNVSDNMYLYGFNFNTDLSQIKSLISELKLDINLDTFTYKTLERNPNVLNQLFLNNKRIYDLLTEKLYRCEDINEYKKLKIIFDGLMTTKLTTSLFRKSNGEIATTYVDFLSDINFELYERISFLTKEYVVTEMNVVLLALDNVLNDANNFKFLFKNIESTNTDKIGQYLRILISFFKSKSVQLRDFNTLYTIDDKFSNLIKVIDYITEDAYSAHRDSTRNLVQLYRQIYEVCRDRAELTDDIIDKILSLTHKTILSKREKFDITPYMTRTTDINIEEGITNAFYYILKDNKVIQEAFLRVLDFYKRDNIPLRDAPLIQKYFGNIDDTEIEEFMTFITDKQLINAVPVRESVQFSYVNN